MNPEKIESNSQNQPSKVGSAFHHCRPIFSKTVNLESMERKSTIMKACG
jgi:hypothetical protein